MSDSFVKASCLFWAMMSEFTIRIDDESYLSANDRFKLYHYNFDVAVQSALALVSNKPVTYSRKKALEFGTKSFILAYSLEFLRD